MGSFYKMDRQTSKFVIILITPFVRKNFDATVFNVASSSSADFTPTELKLENDR